MSGKGSSPRPCSVDGQTFASNWERIFGKPKAPITVTVPPDLPQSPEAPHDIQPKESP